MAEEIDIETVRQCSWAEAQDYWRRLQLDDSDNEAITNAPYVFEAVILRGFELGECIVRYPYSVYSIDDEGNRMQTEQVDGAIHQYGVSCLVESKFYRSSKINVEPIAKLRNQLMRRPAGVLGSVFSFSGFTQPALELARYTAPQSIMLWEKDHIDWCFKNEDFVKPFWAKVHHAVEENSYSNFDFTLAL